MFMLPCHHRVPLHSIYDHSKDRPSSALILCFCPGSSRAVFSATSPIVTRLECKISGGSDRFSEQVAIHILVYGIKVHLLVVTASAMCPRLFVQVKRKNYIQQYYQPLFESL